MTLCIAFWYQLLPTILLAYYSQACIECSYYYPLQGANLNQKRVEVIRGSEQDVQSDQNVSAEARGSMWKSPRGEAVALGQIRAVAKGNEPLGILERSRGQQSWKARFLVYLGILSFSNKQQLALTASIITNLCLSQNTLSANIHA